LYQYRRLEEEISLILVTLDRSGVTRWNPPPLQGVNWFDTMLAWKGRAWARHLCSSLLALSSIILLTYRRFALGEQVSDCLPCIAESQRQFDISIVANGCRQFPASFPGGDDAPAPDCSADVSIGFVGMDKSGSSFMQGLLRRYALSQLLQTRYDMDGSKICAAGATMRWHHACAELQESVVGAAAWLDAYTFSIVRDPWQRAVSAFHFHSQFASERNRYFELAGMNVANSFDCYFMDLLQTLRNDFKVEVHCFRSWIRRMYARYPPGSRHAYLFSAFNHGNQLVHDSYNASQFAYLTRSNGTTMVDQIFNLEELEQSWPELQARICGLRNVSYTEARAQISLNDSPHPPYQEFYDKDTASIVAAYTNPEIRAFQYQPPV